MKIQDLAGKTICILGYGREGKAMVAALEKYAPGCRVTIADENEKCEVRNEKLHVQLGKQWLHDLDRFDIIIKSPGIPPSTLSHFSFLHSQLTSSTHILLDTIADRGVTVIGVTGSKGKSTTSSLIYSILKQDNRAATLAGNIGDPAIAHLEELTQGTILVLEMSSYQLMDLTVSPHIAVVTSFFPDHLDYHGTLEQYLEAKRHITRFQGPDDMVFFNSTMHGSVEIAKEGAGRKIPFSADDAPVRISDTHLRGKHNLSNIAAACMVAAELGVPQKTALNAIAAFRGLPHRLQSLGTHHGIEWIDDAISTTPESTIAGIRALEGNVRTIILGGKDRGYRFDELAHELLEQGVQHVILLASPHQPSQESAPKIREAIERLDHHKELILHDAPDMPTAVRIAQKVTPKGHICLLSTASPSYGMFAHFEEKGNAFQRAVHAPLAS